MTLTSPSEKSINAIIDILTNAAAVCDNRVTRLAVVREIKREHWPEPTVARTCDVDEMVAGIERLRVDVSRRNTSLERRTI